MIKLRFPLALLFAATFVSTAPAEGAGGGHPKRPTWKIDTHIFAANLALADAIADGKVTIPPYGDIAVNPNVLRALRNFPSAYRAGVVGADIYPDIWVGASLAHTDRSAKGQWRSDDWLRQAFNAARSWRDGAERDRAVAYAYGYVTHAAGDMFGHTYVNKKVGGYWQWDKMHTVTAHVVLEGYIARHTPASDESIDAWPRFVVEALIKDPNARANTKDAVHYQTWLRIYDWLGPAIERAKKEMELGNHLPYSANCARHPVICLRKEQMESWRLDIDRGLRALVMANEVLGEKMLDNHLGEGIDALSEWKTEWVPKMFGAHAIGESAKAMDEFMEWLAKWDPLAPINKAIREVAEAFLEHEFPREYQLFKQYSDPAGWLVQQLGPATAQQVIQDLHMRPGPDSLLDWREFEPLYNTVVVSKLVLLDGDGLNELVRRAGITRQLFPAGDAVNVMLGVTKMMDGNDNWNPDSVKFAMPYVPYGAAKGRDVALQARTDIATSLGMPRGVSGFPLYADSEARDKIWSRIFKGYGAGPGMTVLVDAAVLAPPRLPADGQRALAAVREQVERLHDALAVTEAKSGDVPRSCCARDVAELRATRAALDSALSRVRATPTLPDIAGPAGNIVTEIQRTSRTLAVALDRFADAGDAAAATAALRDVSAAVVQLERLLAAP